MKGVFLLARRYLAEVGLDCPVFFCDKGFDLALALNDKAHGHALHTPGGEATAHLFPEQGREAIAHQAVEHAASLLGVDEAHIYLAGVSNGGLYSAWGDLVELDAVDRLAVLPSARHFAHVPRYGLAFAVGVCCQVNGTSGLHVPFEVLDGLALVAGYDVLGREAVLDIHAKGRLGEVANMAHAGLNDKVAAQVFLDCSGLGRRFDYYKVDVATHPRGRRAGSRRASSARCSAFALACRRGLGPGRACWFLSGCHNCSYCSFFRLCPVSMCKGNLTLNVTYVSSERGVRELTG